MLPPIRSDVCMTMPVVSLFSTPLEAAAPNAVPSAGSTAGSDAVFETLVSAFFQAAENAMPQTELPHTDLPIEVGAGAFDVDAGAVNQPALPQEARIAPAAGNTHQNEGTGAPLPLIDATASADLAQASTREVRAVDTASAQPLEK